MPELQQLIENSRANEAIAKKLFEIETQILACQSSHELLKQLLDLIKEKFQLSHISLLLVEPTPLPYLLSGNLQSRWHQDNCQSISKQKLEQLHPKNQPYLSNQLQTLADILPKQQLTNIASVALTPLNLEGKLFGSLLFCDQDKNRYHAKLGTYHLEQLSVKISLCLSNVLIREQLEYMANYDRLTGVANRRLMESTLNEEIIRHRRYQVPFSVIFIDCNKFKQINDTYGHDCGDKVLVYVASQLKELIRENDKCFRYAGDEFVISLASQGYNEALLVAKRLSTFFVDHPMPFEGEALNISISCGVASCDGSQDIDLLLKQADQQLYLDKKVSAASSVFS